MPNHRSNVSLSVFADDTTLITSGRNSEELMENVRVSCVQIANWFERNRAILNKYKTSFSNFHTKSIPNVVIHGIKFLESPPFRRTCVCKLKIYFTN